jgi:hypothetical protein
MTFLPGLCHVCGGPGGGGWKFLPYIPQHFLSGCVSQEKMDRFTFSYAPSFRMIAEIKFFLYLLCLHEKFLLKTSTLVSYAAYLAWRIVVVQMLLPSELSSISLFFWFLLMQSEFDDGFDFFVTGRKRKSGCFASFFC